jgi:hypothetical protein
VRRVEPFVARDDRGVEVRGHRDVESTLPVSERRLAATNGGGGELGRNARLHVDGHGDGQSDADGGSHELAAYEVFESFSRVFGAPASKTPPRDPPPGRRAPEKSD